jgi:haloalkane dehalogenase
MGAVELRRRGEIAYREAAPDDDQGGPVVVLVHGFPESSRMWVPAMEALAGAGHRCVAPDLYDLGDSTGSGPATFERNLEALGEFVVTLDIERVALVVHDWGGFVGLAWASDHPTAVEALVISDTGFFSDGKWHGMAQAMRSDQGEAIIGALDRAGFAALLRASGEGVFDDSDIDAYWAPFEDGHGRRATLEFYRSMDFEKLGPYQGKLGELGVPTLLLWGAEDEFAPIAGAKRFEREIPGSRLVAVEGAGHFLYDEQPQRCVDELIAFLNS